MTHPVWLCVLSSVLGLAVHITMSWHEWRKLVHPNCTLKQYITEDQAGFATACLLSLASYIVLPELGKIGFLQSYVGFLPEVTPMSAFLASFVSSTVGYQLRAYFIKRAGG